MWPISNKGNASESAFQFYQFASLWLIMMSRQKLLK